MSPCATSGHLVVTTGSAAAPTRVFFPLSLNTCGQCLPLQPSNILYYFLLVLTSFNLSESSAVSPQLSTFVPEFPQPWWWWEGRAQVVVAPQVLELTVPPGRRKQKFPQQSSQSGSTCWFCFCATSALSLPGALHVSSNKHLQVWTGATVGEEFST